MTVWFDVDGVAGRAAIYTGADDAPMADPIGNLARVKFHTGLAYAPIVPARTIVTSVAIPAVVSGRSRIINLGAHGQAGAPFVTGHVTIAGVTVPLIGSVPVWKGAKGEAVIWTLGVDATSVLLAELRSREAPVGLTATSRAVTVYVTSRVVS